LLRIALSSDLKKSFLAYCTKGGILLEHSIAIQALKKEIVAWTRAVRPR
jgi:hypothetical protein